MGFNRDYWERFERFVRDCAKKADDVIVVTGPLWMPRPDSDGKWVMQHSCIGEDSSIIQVYKVSPPSESYTHITGMQKNFGGI